MTQNVISYYRTKTVSRNPTISPFVPSFPLGPWDPTEPWENESDILDQCSPNNWIHKVTSKGHNASVTFPHPWSSFTVVSHHSHRPGWSLKTQRDNWPWSQEEKKKGLQHEFMYFLKEVNHWVKLIESLIGWQTEYLLAGVADCLNYSI